MTSGPKTIAVDLSPMLPGGENGGAKVFVIELLKRLFVMAGSTRFLLLVNPEAEVELASWVPPGVERHVVTGNVVTLRSPPARGGWIPWLSWLRGSQPARSSAGDERRTMDVRAFLRRRGAEVLFCPFTAPTYFSPGIPVVSTLYDLQHKSYPQFFPEEDVAHRDRIFRDACRRATTVAAISDYSRESAITHGMDASRIHTIHLRMAGRARARPGEGLSHVESLGLVPGAYYLYPANFWKHKNHEMLLTAFGMACEGGLPGQVKLVCTGSPGPRRDWLIRAAADMGLGNRVLFPGYLDADVLASLLANAAGLVFPSLYEGFGLPVIEAMAAGVPVACSDRTSLPEVAAGAALLFDPRVPESISSALGKLLDAGTRQNLIQAGKTRAREFADSDRMAREYWELLRGAVGNARVENEVGGYYADSWAGPCVTLAVVPGAGDRRIEIELWCPDWLPHPSVTMQTVGPDGADVSLTCARNSEAEWAMPVGPHGGFFELKFSPTFVPSAIHPGSADTRELSVVVRRCELFTSDVPVNLLAA